MSSDWTIYPSRPGLGIVSNLILHFSFAYRFIGLFNPQTLPSGKLIYEFVTEVDSDRAYLETFESSRRIFCVSQAPTGATSANR